MSRSFRSGLCSCVFGIALVTGLAACNASDSPATAAPADANTAQSPAVETRADPTIAAAAETAVRAIMEKAANGPAPVEGKDFAVIKDGSPWQPLTNGETAEIAEVFAYWCPHCAEFQPLVDALKAKLPKTVRFNAIPMTGSDNTTLPSVYFAAEMTGQLPVVHDRMFHAIHVDKTLKPNASRDEVLSFLASHAVDAKALANAMDSFAMKGKLNQAMQFARRSEVQDLPTVVVNGKYRVTAPTQEEILRIATVLALKDNAAQ